MSDLAVEADRRNSAEFGIVPQTVEQGTDSDELSLEERDEAHGGIMILSAAGAFLAG